ncbi:MAG: (4Fe-4S)-binding protein [Desulfonatronovibrio sp. MSAO_Bac4]|nr:MAG: (4Fe-4S)-binding protein [Desulfonatronovibrio sp. MSAO_Bac4]
MLISIASGKGGTGKTTVSASLAAIWDGPVTAVDLDVEEPNLHLFLNPQVESEEKVYLSVPEVDESKCNLCRECSNLCQFKAINVMGSTILTFPEMCHGCGGCMAICPENAISWGRRELGTLSRGKTGPNNFLMGSLRVGEAMSPPLMRAVKERLAMDLTERPGDAIIDAPPGVSCPAVCAVMDTDFILLVTEPTPFGFHDFKLAVEAFAPFKKPMAAVINRSGLGDNSVEAFCRENNIPVLVHIPFDKDIAGAYSRGRVIADLNPGLKSLFVQLAESIKEMGAGGRDA